jgi:integrase/recombinase XerD
MSNNPFIKGFISYLKLERSLSENTIEAYRHDVELLENFLISKNYSLSFSKIELSHLKEFIHWINQLDIKLNARSQARVISGIKAFFKYLLLENEIKDDPSILLESPKLGRKLPDVLDVNDIDKLIAAIDLSTSEGERNKTILETLYSCGLRVSELVNLRISNLFLDIEFIKVTGKGNKERLVPIGDSAIKLINNYILHIRSKLDIKPGNEDILFLNRRGSGLTRVMIFTIIKKLAKEINLKKKISPHTFRHSFATHLIDGGADLRAVQEMLGHESITTTEIYTHLDREYLRNAIIQFHPRS